MVAARSSTLTSARSSSSVRRSWSRSFQCRRSTSTEPLITLKGVRRSCNSRSRDASSLPPTVMLKLCREWVSDAIGISGSYFQGMVCYTEPKSRKERPWVCLMVSSEIEQGGSVPVSQGVEKPMAIQEVSRATFSDLGASHAVVRALEGRGVVEPFPIQTLVLPDALAGRDVLAKSQTGSGKTIAFAVPIVERLEPSGPRPSAVILTPTRELALQVTEELTALARARKLRVAPVYGGVDLRSQARIAERAHILVATPGRLEDLADRRLLDLSKVSIFILDEADRMLDMGFLPQVNQIVRRLPKKRQTMFFSATLDGEAGRLARAYTTDAVRHEVVGKAQTVDEVAHRFVPVTTDTKVAVLAAELKAERGLALVFVRTKRGADRLVRKLKAQGVSALALHGDMTQAARTRAVERFGRGEADTLIATDVAARGLDLTSITHVFNFDPPEDDKSYVHRVGRTARAGRSGTGITFVLPDQRYEVGRIASRLKLGVEFQEEGMTITPPRVLYASRKGRRSRGLGRR